ncbi:MAG: DUF421 domain-containing protein [Clostridia bacterium]|nr:DUF421 domain-containing protein [Clostridia bacterium]
MLTILLRTVVIYLILIIALRLMGKRQIGQLEVSDFVTTLMLSEIATIPMENPQLPLVYALIPIITLLTFEVVSSVVSKRYPTFKRVVNSTPSMLIRRGIIDQVEMRRTRISLEELLSEVRQSGVADISEVYYAILEANGNLTVIPRSSAMPATRSDMSVDVPETGIAHIVISEGRLNRNALKYLGISREKVDKILRKRGVQIHDVYLMTCDDALNFMITTKGTKQ